MSSVPKPAESIALQVPLLDQPGNPTNLGSPTTHEQDNRPSSSSGDPISSSSSPSGNESINSTSCYCISSQCNISCSTPDQYEESALYIQQGEDDAKFYHHPNNKWAERAYVILHYQAYYIIHFIICILLLLLAFAETPSVGQELDEKEKKILVSIHGLLEIIFLILLGVNVGLHLVWFRSNFVRHRIMIIVSPFLSHLEYQCTFRAQISPAERLALTIRYLATGNSQTIILAVMFLEALTVVIRQQSHIRVTRILRPFFLLDTHYMCGVRRVTRQIVQIMKPILDVLLFLIFFILLFGLFGYLIFSETDPDYFSNFSRSCLSLFITASTANNPDVMMESYAQHGATPIFYVIYLIITLYFASNVLLAVVYASFSEADKKKFKMLFFHKRDALLKAFQVLSKDTSSDKQQGSEDSSSDKQQGSENPSPDIQQGSSEDSSSDKQQGSENPSPDIQQGSENPSSDKQKVQFHDFLLMMQHYRPRMPEWQVFCIFKSLNKDPQDQYRVNKEDFLCFYEVLDFRWSQVKKVNDNWSKLQWYSKFSPRAAKPLEFIHKVVSHRIYKFLIGVVVLVNFIFLIVVANRIKDATERYEEFHKVLPGTFVFLTVYILDITFSMLGHGPYEYFKKFWNMADVVVIIISLISAIINIYHITWAVILPLKLIRLIRLKRRYRELMNTMVDLAPRLLSVLVLILIIYYCFAIIGMEFLYGKVEQGCCTDALYNVGDYFKDNSSVTSQNVYYLNNFDNILQSYATLFLLMVVNNWYIIMEGFASEVHPHTTWLTRIYFMMFYIIILVVLQVVLAFIVEAFVLKIQAIRKTDCQKHPKDSNCGCPGLDERKKNVIITMVTLVEKDLAMLLDEMEYMDHYKGPQKWLNKHIRILKRTHFKIADRKEVNLAGSRSHTKEDIHQLHYKDEIQIWKREVLTTSCKDKRNIGKLCNKLGGKVLDFIID